ncbi:hypothetical protein ACIRIU_28070 [Streptomyces sp. NPDC102351]|uniref:hypothetical protein n=1 Tax=Streptomyces sp. NPDC102351 TaxID=3366158 RepID=UPI003824D550
MPLFATTRSPGRRLSSFHNSSALLVILDRLPWYFSAYAELKAAWNSSLSAYERRSATSSQPTAT